MKIPPQAKCVFQGELFGVYQWRQEMYDGSFATYEMIKRVSTVDIIGIVDDRILLLSQEQPMKPLYPGLPGGKIDEGEEPLAAAKRELLEETGYASNSWELLASYNEGSKIDFENHLFLARDCKKTTGQHLDAGEKITVQLATFDELLASAKHPRFTAPLAFRFELYEAMADAEKKKELKKKLGL